MLRVSVHRIEGADDGEDRELFSLYVDESLVTAQRCVVAVSSGLAMELRLPPLRHVDELPLSVEGADDEAKGEPS